MSNPHDPKLGQTPITPERIKHSHSSMTKRALIDINDPLGHRIYTQDMDDGCYICALLKEIDRLEQELAQFNQTYDQTVSSLGA